jgi:predicted O-methyltransferase YrrM
MRQSVPVRDDNSDRSQPLEAMMVSADIEKLILKIMEYEQRRGAHASGTIGADVLLAIANNWPTATTATLETGCGKSTILFSQLSPNHHVYTVDDSAMENNSLSFVRESPEFAPANVRFTFGPTQATMASSPPTETLDVALIDGPHAYPYPEIEYFHIYPRLRPDALLIIDDLHIPTIYRLYEFLREDDMFSRLEEVGTTGFLRRTQNPIFPPLSDLWNEQNFNKTRFPIPPPY